MAIEIKVDVGGNTSPNTLVSATLSQDGNQWCVLAGADLQVGIAGFGDTPVDAVRNFITSFHTDKLRSKS